MGAFAAAAAVKFADPVRAVNGTYAAAGGGAAIPVRIIATQHDPDVRLFETDARAPGWELRVRTAEVPTKPLEGDVLVIAGDSYTVRAVRADALGLEWTLDCDR